MSGSPLTPGAPRARRAEGAVRLRAAAGLCAAALALVACQPPRWPPVRVMPEKPPPPGAEVAKEVIPQLVPGPLEVPARFRSGAFATPRELLRPSGFRVGVFAAGLGPVRFMAFTPGGDLMATVPREGKVLLLPDRDRDGVADDVVALAEGLDRPHGIDVRQGDLIVAEMTRVLRFPRGAEAVNAAVAGGGGKPTYPKLTNPQVLADGLPAGGNHWTRTVVAGPDGNLYVSIGSSCNVCEEKDERRATVMVFRPDGGGGRVFARGLRNAVGLTFHPRTGELWATDNGRDLLGDDVPPEEVNVVREGRHYGWPRCFGDRVPDPQTGDARFCAGTEPPVVKMQAHSAPLGLRFYTGTAFPPEWRGDLYIAFHGSWNRSERTGYKVVRVRVAAEGEERPKVGAVEDFVGGFLRDGQVWGRPVDVIVGPRGDMYVSDDFAGAIYRIWWQG